MTLFFFDAKCSGVDFPLVPSGITVIPAIGVLP